MTDNLPALVDYSKALAASDLLPDAYRGKPANVLVAIEYGKALGISPLASIQGVTIIKGKPTASASLMAGLVRMHGHTLRVTGDHESAECVIIRADDPDFQFRAVWTMERAKRAGLLGNQSWQKYPDAMLKARAISECARNACSEILAGVQYTPEELGGPEPEPATVTLKRSRPAAQAPDVDAPEPVDAVLVEPEPVAEPEPVDVTDAVLVEDESEPVDPRTAEPDRWPVPEGDPITAGQLKALHAALGRLGIKGATDRARGLTMIGGIVGRPIESTKDLTKAEAARVLDALTDEGGDDE